MTPNKLLNALKLLAVLTLTVAIATDLASKGMAPLLVTALVSLGLAAGYLLGVKLHTPKSQLS